LDGLEAMNRHYGICGVFQNHSGSRSVGAPMWDIYELIKECDHRYIAAHFDIGHATVEGGNAWPIDFRCLQPMLGAVVVKDFNWVRESPGKRPEVQWCPIGKGMIDPSFCDMLLESGFQGPVTMHYEYHVDGKTQAERTQNWIKAMRQDTLTLRNWLHL